MFEIALISITLAVTAWLVIAIINLRRVVRTNDVHIVQTRNATTSYGKATGNGNVYYEFPSWMPIIGMSKIVLPTSVFDLDLAAYEAYDKGRVPFIVDIKAFFRIEDSNLAAARVASFEELHSQLKAIVQGAVRSILADANIEEILQGRNEYADSFTKAVEDQIKEWGVVTVKKIEFMNIVDGRDSQVIKNIMEKKKSQIDMESRLVVADNTKKAQIAEIEAQRETDMQAQQALEAVGRRTAEKDLAIGTANEQASQAVKEQQRITKEKEMAVLAVDSVKKAEIARDVNVVRADEEKQTSIIKAEGQKQQTTLIAEGELAAKKHEAAGITVEGQAKADAEKAMQLAPIEAQIVLAKEIGENQAYQNYLLSNRQIEATQAVGIEQAKALASTEAKVIVNSGDVSSGMSSLMDIFSPKGGTAVGGALEALANTEQGKALMEKFGIGVEPTPPTKPNTVVRK